MSEFQIYEFKALDRALTTDEQRELRRFSSRATITARRFVVDYSWGDFKGDPDQWMNKYFDSYFHIANWGTRELALRLPKNALPLETAQRYCLGETASAREHGEHVILEFACDGEGEGGWIDEDDNTLDEMLPIRAELMDGDYRALYLAWLGGAQYGAFDDGEEEPPCPPGLASLSPALEEFARFLGLDSDLIEAAAAGSPAPIVVDDSRFEGWLLALSDGEKAEVLFRLARGEDSGLRADLLRRFRAAQGAGSAESVATRRTVGELLQAAEAKTEERRRAEQEKEAREEARLAREAAVARERHLTALAARADDVWRDVDLHIATKQPKSYDTAVRLLRDLREACARSGRETETAGRIAQLCALHANKPSLIRRLRDAGLVE